MAWLILIVFAFVNACKIVASQSSTNNIVFDLPDLTVDHHTSSGVINLEAFKSSTNDLIIEKKEIEKYGQLNWLSIGYPTLVKQIINGNNVTFNLKPEGFDIGLDMLTSKLRSIFKEVVKRKYNIDIKEEQIVNLVAAKLTCQIEFYTNSEKILITGQVVQLNKFPLKVLFSAPVNSKERVEFEKRLDQYKQNLDLDIVCQVSSQGKAYRQNTLIITGTQLNQFGITDKIFGLGDEKYVSRNQISQLSSELYVKLNVIEDYQMPETQFKENFVNDFLTQTATQIYLFTNIDQALSQMSKYNFEIDLQPSVIKSEMSRIFTVAKKNSLEVLTLNKTAYEELITTYGKTTGGSAGGSFLGFSFGGSASYVTQQSNKWIDQNTSFSNQLSELNQYYENEVEWERSGNIIVPKSVKVSKLSRASFNKNLVFSRVKREYYDSPYQKTFVLNTLNSLYQSQNLVDTDRRLSQLESVSSKLKTDLKTLSSKIESISSSFKTEIKIVSSKTENISSKFETQITSIFTQLESLKTLINQASLNQNRNMSGSIVKNWPDAIKCGIENENILGSGAIFFIHGATSFGAHYVQVLAGEDRAVEFDSNGNFKYRRGHDASSSGCQGRSIKELFELKRAFYLAN